MRQEYEAMASLLNRAGKRAGERNAETVFHDWLVASLAALALRIAGVEGPDDLPPEAGLLFSGLQERYTEEGMDELRDAFGALARLASEEPKRDALHEFYCYYFDAEPLTPPSEVDDELIAGVANAVQERITQSIQGSRIASAVRALAPEQELWDFLRTQREILAPAMSDTFAPVVMADPLCGSGSALLAFVTSLPQWQVYNGFIQFVAYEIDPLAALMARVNLALRGITLPVKLADELSSDEIAEIAQPQLRRAYDEYRKATKRGDEARARAIAERVCSARHEYNAID